MTHIRLDPLRINGVAVDQMDEEQLCKAVEALTKDLLRCRKEREDYYEKALQLSGIQGGEQS